MFVISAAKLGSFFHKSKSETTQKLSETIQFLKLFRIQGNDGLVLLLLAGSLLRLFNLLAILVNLLERRVLI